MIPAGLPPEVGRRLRADLRTIFDAAIAAVNPSRLTESVVQRFQGCLEIGAELELPGSGIVIRGPIGVIGAGKAAVGMAASLEGLCAGEIALSGVVIAPSSQFPIREYRSSRIEVLPGEHPTPSDLSEVGTKRLLAFLETPHIEAFVCLLSGGASSLLVSPIPPLTLEDKRTVVQLLLNCGAPIDEVNCVRKHLSSVKGGRILRKVVGRTVVSLILSDVVRDDSAAIGSGPAVPDGTSYQHAIDILRAWALFDRCPASAIEVLRRGARAEIEDTVRPQTTDAGYAVPIVIGSNTTACAGAAAAARQLGYVADVRQQPLEGDTKNCAEGWFRDVLRVRPREVPSCFIAGGETTVRVRGKGMGGRNQEFALFLSEMAKGLNVAVLSAGTDGFDGPSDAAGAFVDGATAQRAALHDLNAEEFLRNNDSFRFFQQLGDLLIIGATGTNVMDIKIALFGPPSAG